jgi:hypothetical protein
VNTILRYLIIPDINELGTSDNREMRVDGNHIMIPKNGLDDPKLISGNGKIHAGKYRVPFLVAFLRTFATLKTFLR